MTNIFRSIFDLEVASTVVINNSFTQTWHSPYFELHNSPSHSRGTKEFIICNQMEQLHPSSFSPTSHLIFLWYPNVKVPTPLFNSIIDYQYRITNALIYICSNLAMVLFPRWFICSYNKQAKPGILTDVESQIRKFRRIRSRLTFPHEAKLWNFRHKIIVPLPYSLPSSRPIQGFRDSVQVCKLRPCC